MISPRWRKVLRDLWSNKGRTVLVVLSIATGIFAIGLVSTTEGLLARNMNESYEAINPADITFLAEGMQPQLVQQVLDTGLVDAAAGRRYLQARIKSDGEWKNATIYALPDYENITVKKITPVEGDYPPADGELLLEKSTLKILDAKVGDELTVQGPDGKLHSMRVGGVAQDMNVIPSNFSNSANGFITFPTLAEFAQPPVFNQLDLAITDKSVTEDQVRSIAVELRDGVLKDNGVAVLAMIVYPPGKHPLSSIIRTLSIFLGAIGILALLLGAFLVINTINAIVSGQIRQIGVMKAVGGSTGQITRMYLALVLAFGFLAFLVAAPLAVLGGRAVVNMLANMINFNVTNTAVPAWVFGLEVAVGLLVPLLAALWPVWSGSRVSVREAISSYGIEESSKGQWLDRLLNRFHWLSRPLMLSLRNTFRRKGRLALTLITLTLAGAIFVSIFTVRSSMLRTLDQALAFWNFDVQMSFLTQVPGVDFVAEAEQVPGVTTAENWTGALAFLQRPDGTENEGTIIYGIPGGSELIRPDLREGRWLEEGDTDQVVVNTDFIGDEQGIAVGSDINLNINGQEQSWQVVGIIQSRLSGPALYSNFDYLNGIVGQAGKTSYLFVQTDDHSKEGRDEAAGALEDHFRKLGIPPISVETVSDIQSGAENQFNILILFMLVMAVLLAAVGCLGLMGTMGLNVMERTREIGVMRSIGATNGTVRLIFVSEGMIIGFLSWVLAALLAVPVSLLLSYIVGHAFFKAALSYSFSVGGVFIWLALAIALSAFSSLLPARRAARLTVREVLAYE